MGNGRKDHQHITPKVYLRGFADARGFVTVQRRSGDEANLQINNVAVRKRFYNFKNSQGAEIGGIEEWLDTGVESPIGPVFKRLRAGQPVRTEDVPALARFVVVQLLRTPSTEATLMQLDQHLGPMLLAHAVFVRHEVDPTALSAESVSALMRAATDVWERRPLDGRRNSRLRTIARKMDELTTELSSWTWSVLTASSPLLITGDAPVVTFQPTGGWSGILPTGSPVYLPLTPRLLLVGEKHCLGGDGALHPELAAHVNRRIAIEADDAIIKSRVDDWPRGLTLLNTRPTLPQPTITWSKSNSTTSSLPTRFPAVVDSGIAELLQSLEAEDNIE